MLEDGIEDGTNPNSVVPPYNSPEPEISRRNTLSLFMAEQFG